MKNIEARIKALEEKLLHSDVRKNPQLLDELVAPEFEEIGSNGKVTSREQVIDWLLTKEQDVRWSLTEFRIRQLSPDMVLAIYRARKNDIVNDSYKGSIRSSLWKRTGERWQIVFHQGTKVLD
ncbi:MAG: DUF4440 domain-containing protein [Gammaproteobacteria bacterium]|jgi:hypothetical protein